MCDTYSVFTVLKLANDVIDKEFSGISPLDRGMVLYSVIKDALDQPEKFAAAIDTDSVDDAGQSSSGRSEEHTSELQSLMRNSYAVFCLKTKKTNTIQ